MSSEASGEVVYAYVIVTSEPIHSEQLDITGYTHNYWPGEILMLDAETAANGTHLLEHIFTVDELLSFHTQLVRVAKGTLHRDGDDVTVTFPEAYRHVLGYIQLGAARKMSMREVVADFADGLKQRLETEPVATDDPERVLQDVFDAIDAEVRLVR